MLASICFLPRLELYKSEKPYSIRYEPHGDVPQTNMNPEAVDNIPIKDLRPCKDKLKFQEDGFIVKELKSELRYEDYDSPDAVSETYVGEVAEMLREVTGSKNVAILEYLVRRRHPTFPVFSGMEFSTAQPVSTAHIGLIYSFVRVLP